MYHLPLTLETPAENLALDEALVEGAQAGETPGEVLRLWEPRRYFVVLGRSSDAQREVRLAACAADGVPVLRRPSGGATVLLGPGCLMYAVVLDLTRRPELRSIDRAHELVLARHAAALGRLAPLTERAGTSDLVLAARADSSEPLSASATLYYGALKFSGNSMRIRRDHLLYHGTILYDFPLDRLGRWLAAPARQPAYRDGREHGAFVTNFPAPRERIAAALVQAWKADCPLPGWPERRTVELATTRYATLQW
jgi:lipoate-protein ligase A